ncbi:DUF1405 domain-containing protein [Cohnella sp. CFH 77786]|uniref:DUF1405 domain-containing protein n=1 Tax=Cohnella sp. CFH 77786 TaxID=2662265 RepID=UPI001C60CB61|nr:DUF1405 domain-containing protein [Cohnella sp. CFH 77786]MBW5446614.1 DUF1405 domain-containing protein [Cohnella sp. CFH 77786]
MGLRFLWSRALLMHPSLLWPMMIIYIPGTVYGYYWYKDQLNSTWNNHPHWQIVFVPDSPTASLWFALAVLWLWISPEPTRHGWIRGIRGVLEALGVVTSVKYGVWATAIILAGYAQGTPLDGASWMLMIGHTAMAVCALLYARFFRFGAVALLVAAAWTFLNDTVDYAFGVFPYLPDTLDDDIAAVCVFTVALTAFSVAAAGAARYLSAEGRTG